MDISSYSETTIIQTILSNKSKNTNKTRNTSDSFTTNNSSTVKAFDLTENTSKDSIFTSAYFPKDQSEYLDQYIKVLATWISEYADYNSDCLNLNKKVYTNLDNDCFDAFFNLHLPEISMYDYLLRIVKLSEIEYSTLIIACLYIDRIVNSNKIKVTWFNIYRYVNLNKIII